MTGKYELVIGFLLGFGVAVAAFYMMGWIG
jgi:hypothetical protein